jgi:chemotaxis protein MotB
MARRKHHEEHENHERWAIPYGDLVTLLLAFFVVMYSISQVNEGKYRVVSESLNAAFRGDPTTPNPIQIGQATVAAPIAALPQDLRMEAMRQLAQQVDNAMAPLIMQGLVDVGRGDGKLTIAIRSDILFPSGVAKLSPEAQPVIHLLAPVLRDFPVDVKVQGHTDNVPVLGGQFASNWDLSAARAVSVVNLLVADGVPPQRLSATGFGEYQPVLPNTTPDGRNANRRVVLSVEPSDPEKPAGGEETVPQPAPADAAAAPPITSAAPAQAQPAPVTAQQ